MSVSWIVAFCLLAVCVVVTALILLGTLRRISAVLEQAEARLAELPPTGRPGGLEPGSVLPPFAVKRFGAGTVSDEVLRGSPALLLFVSSTCPACSSLIRDIKRNEGVLPLPLYVVVTSSDEMRKLGLDSSNDVLIQPANELSVAFRTSTTPHAFAIDRKAVIVASDTPNTFAQLTALLKPAMRKGGDAITQRSEEVVPA